MHRRRAWGGEACVAPTSALPDDFSMGIVSFFWNQTVFWVVLGRAGRGEEGGDRMWLCPL